MIVVLDSGVLGYIIHPNADLPDVRECIEWYLRLVSGANVFCLPEIIDYESRRKYLHIESRISIDHLDGFKDTLEYLPLTTNIMLKAAQIWADARKIHFPTASPDALDVDVILAAQALDHSREIHQPVVVATTDVGDLRRLGLDARIWRDIPNRGNQGSS